MPAKLIIPIGTQYGHLITESHIERRDGKPFVMCRCVCGTARIFKANNLRTGNSTSCGCQRGTHHQSKIPEYNIWASMKARCLNPKSQAFGYYGGRGITLCREWAASFEAFYRDMGPRPSADYSIERKDNSGPYAPENCEWATRAKQDLNKRSVRIITFRNESHDLKTWSRILNINHATLFYRVTNWTSIEKAFTEPVRLK